MPITISFLTLFPDVIRGFVAHSILGRAEKKGLVRYIFINIRDFSTDTHHTVDERPYGGGAGMLMKIEPIVAALEAVQKQEGEGYKILLSPQGRRYHQPIARSFVASHKHIIFICGHYEGIDSRIIHFIDEEISIGDYILSGGEVAALVVTDSLVRLIPGVLKKEEAAQEESFYHVPKDELFRAVDDDSVFQEPGETVELLEYPQFTRPPVFRGYRVPQILLSGDHQAINKWRLKEAWRLTKSKRKK